MCQNFFASTKSTALRNYSPFTTRHSLLAFLYSPFAAVQPVANRQSLIAAVLAQQETRSPKFSTDYKSVSKVNEAC